MDETPFLNKLADVTHVPAGEITNETALKPSEWDSVDVLDLIAAIDEVYGTTVPAKSLAACTTVGELRGLIRSAAAQ